MTPFEAGRVLAQAAQRLGWEEIPDHYLTEGKLGDILLPEDYVPLKNVSTNLTTTCDPTPGCFVASAMISIICCSPSMAGFEDSPSILLELIS